jgi:hypothetical protein
MRPRGQPLTPLLELGRFQLGRARRAELIQQHQHRLAGPAEQLHLAGQIAGFGLARVDQVQQQVAALAHVAQRLLAHPERAVVPAVPDL